ncbi:MAG: hypothetical protein WC656_01795 [Sulfurimonas sp.]|jgi:hypothetical protein
MPEYHIIMAAYAPIFSLSVAMNFAYAASKPFREAMKAGFLQNIKVMEKWYDEKQIEVGNKITLLSEVDEESKESIKQELQNSLVRLQEEDNKLKDDIELSQSNIADEIKPVYIYTALFSLIVLFLGGQESAYSRFPIEGIQLILIFTFFFYIMVIMLKRLFNRVMTAHMSTFYILLTTPIILLLPCDFLSEYISNKYFLNITIVVAFLPFILSAIRLSWLSARIEILTRRNFNKLYKSIAETEKQANRLRESKDYFNNIKPK